MSEYSPEITAQPDGELHSVADAYFVEQDDGGVSLAFSIIRDGEIQTQTIENWFVPQVIVPKQEGSV